MNPSGKYKIISAGTEFWKAAGIKPVYPLTASDLEHAAFLLYPVNIIKLNHLSISSINQWLSGNRISNFIHTEEKQLFGLLFVRKGHAFIFLDGTSSPGEQLITLAHEIAHYILEIDQPRKIAIAKYGTGIIDVFDGLRQPSESEKLSAIISHIGVRPHLHLVEKLEMNNEGRWRVWVAESDADALAWELLAPEYLVRKRLKSEGNSLLFNELKDTLPNLLSDYFQLPQAIAEVYANKLIYSWTSGGPSVAEWLGLQ